VYPQLAVSFKHTSENIRGVADIDREFISPNNERFVVHDSVGFESADEDNMEVVKKFVAQRKAQPQIEDQLHAIW
jgi:flagellar basal body-associated protein FliL